MWRLSHALVRETQPHARQPSSQPDQWPYLLSPAPPNICWNHAPASTQPYLPFTTTAVAKGPGVSSCCWLVSPAFHPGVSAYFCWVSQHLSGDRFLALCMYALPSFPVSLLCAPLMPPRLAIVARYIYGLHSLTGKLLRSGRGRLPQLESTLNFHLLAVSISGTGYQAKLTGGMLSVTGA